MKRFFCVFFALALVLACLPAWAEEAENLVRNGDFSRINNSGMPEDWEREMWHSDAGVSFLTVENNGPEIPKAQRRDIFLPGFTTKSEGHGNGLGIVTELVEKYSGTICVESNPQRTCFSCTIPKSAPEALT